ncbi:hypothetical protein ACFL96_15785 [Thermoproteota archaeon]
MDHSVRITEHGFLAVEESIEFINLKSSSVILPQFELNYDSISADSISAITILGTREIEVLKSSIDDGTKLTFRPKMDYDVASNDKITIDIQFYISNQVNITSTSYYSARLPLIPSMNKIIDDVNSNMFLPVDSNIINMPKGFFMADETLSKIAGSFQHVMSNAKNTQTVEFTLDPAHSFTILDFPSVKRTFISSTDGSVIVHDEIRVINKGEMQANRIRLLRLNNEGVNIEIVPIGNPPLINRLSVSLFDEVFDIRSIYRSSLSQDEEIIFAIEYPVSSSYATFNDGITSFNLPLNSPIDGVVERFTVNIAPMSGVEILEGESLTILDVTPYNEDKYYFSTGIQIAWASGTILPVATVLFMVSLVALLLTKPKFYRIKDEGKGSDILEEMIGLFEEKTSTIENIFQNYKSKSNISKSSLVETKNYFESLKGKSAGKMGEIRTKLKITKPYLEDNLIELAKMDKEYNRSVSDIIKLYEQFSTGIIRKDTFEGLLKKHEKRFRTTKDNLIKNIDNIHNEIEK